MSKIICLWSGPRNISTALMYSFAQRSDMEVIDEPLYGYYLKKTGADHPGKEEIIDAMENDSGTVWQTCQSKSEKKNLFIKNMAHHAVDLPVEWYTNPTAIFLIRDPHDMIPSLARVLEKPAIADTGLKRQVEILDQLSQSDNMPLIIEGTDILKNPAGMLERICQKLELSFDESMLSWPAGPLPEDGIWAKYWYDQVHESTGFKQWKPSRESVPEALQPLLEECLPYYEKLKSLKLAYA